MGQRFGSTSKKLKSFQTRSAKSSVRLTGITCDVHEDTLVVAAGSGSCCSCCMLLVAASRRMLRSAYLDVSAAVAGAYVTLKNYIACTEHALTAARCKFFLQLFHLLSLSLLPLPCLLSHQTHRMVRHVPLTTAVRHHLIDVALCVSLQYSWDKK